MGCDFPLGGEERNVFTELQVQVGAQDLSNDWNPFEKASAGLWLEVTCVFSKSTDAWTQRCWGEEQARASSVGKAAQLIVEWKLLHWSNINFLSIKCALSGSTFPEEQPTAVASGAQKGPWGPGPFSPSAYWGFESVVSGSSFVSPGLGCNRNGAEGWHSLTAFSFVVLSCLLCN